MGVSLRSVVTVVVAWLLLAVPRATAAQSLDVGDPFEDYLRLLQISGAAPLGSFFVRPLIFREDLGDLTSEPHPWAPYVDPLPRSGENFAVSGLDARLRSFINTRLPSIQNDGPIWQGRGLTTGLDFGATVRWRAASLTVKPSLIYTQNTDLRLAPVTVVGMPEYAYPWRRIDMPQRFGPDSFWRLDPGQSELRVTAWGVTAGLGTRNLWWGPGIRSAILMSNNAGGFPHVFLGTRGPRDIGIGTIEANWIMGRLAQSDYFDPSVENDTRFLTGLVLAYSPSFLEGLSVGFSRVFYGAVPSGGQPLSDLFLVLQGVRKKGLTTPDNPTGDDDKDQMLSLFGRWALPASGFEVYAEWARNDHAGDFYDLLLEPEHSQAYTLGLQKGMELEGGKRLTLRGELTHLEREATFRLRASPVYYTHHIVTQGYTHRGEVIGAGIGPGGNQQHVGAELYADWGRAGLVLQRRVHDNDAYYEWAEDNDRRFDNHHVSFDIGVDALVFRGDFELGGGVVYTRELNRWFFGPKSNNFNFSLSARWRPGVG